MNEWSRMRKRIILGIVVAAVAILVGVPFYFLIYEKPTCSDGKKNGDETGLDCGGSCQRVCTAESLPLILEGDPRVLTIAPNTFEVVALVENPNPNAEIYRANYTIKVYDLASAIPVKVIENATFVPKGATFAIFEGPFTLEEAINPSRATLEWRVNDLSWSKNPLNPPEIQIAEISLSQASTTPRLSALVKNVSLENVSNIDFVALLYDGEGNIFAASKTYIDSLSVGENEAIIFSWPRPFPRTAGHIEIIKRIFPDASFIR